MEEKRQRVIKKNKKRATIQTIISLPKSIWFNMRCFPFKTAIKLPVLVSHKTKLKKLKKGVIVLPENFTRFGIKIGIGSNERIPEQKSMIFLNEGHITFLGTAKFSAGVILSNEGEMVIGDNLFTNNNATIWCGDRIEIGDDNLWGWNVFLRDEDGHCIIVDGERRPTHAPIHIGDHCWLASETVFLKDAYIPDGCVVGYRSVITKGFDKENAIIAGTPAKVVRENIGWER